MEATLPAQGVMTLMRQPERGRLVAHLLYASPVKRGNGVEVIEDIIPLHDIALTLRVEQPVKRVYLAPQMEEIPLMREGDKVCVYVPRVECHQMVVFE